MKFLKSILLLVAASMMFISCTSINVLYKYGLTSVERPEDTAKRYGDYVITQKVDDEKGKYIYEDEMIESVWYIGSTTIFFDIKNKTNSSIRIIWDEAAFVDDKGNTSRVMHNGVKYIDRNNALPPSVIVRKGSISEIVVPTDKISYSSGWYEAPIFENSFTDEQEADSFAKETLGKTIQVLLPLEIEGVTNDYIFIFKVEDYSTQEVSSFI